MLNEREDFLCYTNFPEYSAKNKNDTSYLGRFNFIMLEKFYGIIRILTIIARHYMFEDKVDIKKAYRAICAWSSIPSKENEKSKEEWEFTTDFREYHNEFPELVDSSGRGWFYRHVHNIINFADKNKEKIREEAYTKISNLKENFDNAWASHVRQMQFPLFHSKTKGAWMDFFEAAIANAKELGPLKDKTIPLPDNLKIKIQNVNLSDKLIESDKRKVRQAMEFLICYYIVNKQPDTEWIQHSTTDFEAYLGGNFSKKILPKIPRDIIIRDEKQQVSGVARYKVSSEFLP